VFPKLGLFTPQNPLEDLLEEKVAKVDLPDSGKKSENEVKKYT